MNYGSILLDIPWNSNRVGTGNLYVGIAHGQTKVE